MADNIIDIANRFLSEDNCTNEELVQLKKWISDPSCLSEVEDWLHQHWDLSPEIDSNTLLETLFKQIHEYQTEQKKKIGISFPQIIRLYQKFAAFFLIPIIGLGILYGISQINQSSVSYSETIAPRGQKSQIVLSDGTRVWLNSDTKIKYPGNFDRKQRDIFLEGEAFFEVTKNKHRPFIVHTSDVDIKVLGTKFNVRAYADEEQIETSLFEGKVNLCTNQQASKTSIRKEMEPGESIVYLKKVQKLRTNTFQKEEIEGWRNNQLIFKNDTFSNLVKKIERWYNIKVLYDQKQFSDRRLTVELFEGERLEMLLEIVSRTLSVEYSYKKGTVILKSKKENM